MSEIKVDNCWTALTQSDGLGALKKRFHCLNLETDCH